ncbi:hypothetical protein ACWEP4_37825 [Streptomyces sp. NPDC004227]
MRSQSAVKGEPGPQGVEEDRSAWRAGPVQAGEAGAGEFAGVGRGDERVEGEGIGGVDDGGWASAPGGGP